jgi:hypothetical protein
MAMPEEVDTSSVRLIDEEVGLMDVPSAKAARKAGMHEMYETLKPGCGTANSVCATKAAATLDSLKGMEGLDEEELELIANIRKRIDFVLKRSRELDEGDSISQYLWSVVSWLFSDSQS